MSNVFKGNIVEFNTDEKLFVASGKLLDRSERKRIDQKSETDEKMRSSDAMDNAESVLKNAIVKSRDMLIAAQEEAQTQVALAKEQGYAAGYDSAYKTAFEQNKKAAAEKWEPLADAVRLIDKRCADSMENNTVQSQSLDKAFELAKMIIETELKVNEKAFLSLYQKAASHVGNAETIVLRTGPRSYAAAEANREWLEKQTDGLQRFEIVKSGDDDGLCVLETSLGNVDASADVQLERAMSILSQT